MPVIILEGCDGSGKSVLARKLCRTYNARYVHVSKPKTNQPFYEYVRMLTRLNLNKTYVFDRFFHGERVYGPVYRQKDGLTDEKQRYLELLLQKHQAKLIYCWQGNNELAWTFATRGEKHTRFEDIPKLKKLYDETLEKCTIPVLAWRYSTDSYQAVKTFINLKRFNSELPGIKEPCRSLIGHHSPDILFIGDSKNPRRTHLPVFCSTSGMFLMKSLKDINRSYALVNSLNDGKLLTWKQVYKIQPKKVVFLGKQAFNRLGYKLLEFNPTTCDHPQFAKRFYGKEAAIKYAKKLSEASQ